MRLPLIPGCNDGAEDVAAAARFVGSLPNRPEMNLLPYHNLGESKYGMIGRPVRSPAWRAGRGEEPEAAGASRALPAVRPGQSGQPGGDAIALE